MEKVIALTKENEEMKKINEMETKIALQQKTEKELAQHVMIEIAITKIAGHVQRQNTFNESTKTALDGLVEEVKKHQDLFQETVRVLLSHEQHIMKTGTASQEMARYINALIQEDKKKRL